MTRLHGCLHPKNARPRPSPRCPRDLLTRTPTSHHASPRGRSGNANHPKTMQITPKLREGWAARLRKASARRGACNFGHPSELWGRAQGDARPGGAGDAGCSHGPVSPTPPALPTRFLALPGIESRSLSHRPAPCPCPARPRSPPSAGKLRRCSRTRCRGHPWDPKAAGSHRGYPSVVGEGESQWGKVLLEKGK